MLTDINEQRLKLKAVRALAIDCRYDEALSLLDSFLKQSPDDLEGLRLRGNVLERKALDIDEFSTMKLLMSSEYLAARECYQQILRLDPRSTVALIDLGDHYKNLDDYDKAFFYYERAVDFLRKGETRLVGTEEIEELLQTCFDLGREENLTERAARLSTVCKSLLTGVTDR